MREPGSYLVNEIFLSLQGEGVRAGTLNVFVRFAKCNLKCALEKSPVSPGGWICDTDFEFGETMDLPSLVGYADALIEDPRRLIKDPQSVGVIFTGGEPSLQLDAVLVRAFRDHGFFTAIETNGTRDVNGLGLDWITVSPKVPEDKLKQRRAHEVKYVVTAGDPIPRTCVISQHKLLSPAFRLDGTLPKENLDHAIRLVTLNAGWRLSVQQHKGWGLR